MSERLAPPRWQTLAFWILLGLISTLACSETLFYARFPFDDAYIFMRIARRFAETGEPYFNAHERVMGHSSHLWLVTLAALTRVLGSAATAVKLLECACTCGCLLLTSELLRRTARVPSLVALLIATVLVQLLVVPIAGGLMEAPMAVALIVGTLLALEEGRDLLGGLLAGLAVSTRYELILLLPFALFLAHRRPRFLVGLAVPAAIFVTFAWSYYGTLIPMSVIAKEKVYSGQSERILSPLTGGALDGTLWRKQQLLVVTALAAALLGECLWHVLRRPGEGPRWVLAAAAFPILVILAYLAGDALVFEWYWPPVLFPLVLAAVGLVSRTWHGWVILGALLYSLRLLLHPGLLAAEGYARDDPARYWPVRTNARAQEYILIGESLRATRSGARILSSEIGGLGWGFYPGKIIDADALVSPENLKFHPMRVPDDRPDTGSGAIPVGAVEEGQPDFVVSMEGFSIAFRRAVSDGRLREYVLREQLPLVPLELQKKYGLKSAFWLSTHIEVYERRSL
jgi:hypothetical protein